MESISIEAYFRRQMTAIGVEAMQQISQMHVLVVGLRGCGVEIAKNLAMSGIQRVTLADEELVREEDISLGFVFRRGDERKHKATIVAARLAELVPFADMRTLNGNLSHDLLVNFHVIVLASTNMTHEEVIAIDEFCRAQDPPIGVVVVDNRGLFGFVFSDFSPTHNSYIATGGATNVEVRVQIDRSKVFVDDNLATITVEAIDTSFRGYVGVGDQVSLHSTNTAHYQPLLFAVETIPSDSSLCLRLLKYCDSREFELRLSQAALSIKRVDTQIFETSHRSLRQCLFDPGPILCPVDEATLDSDRGRGFSLHLAMLGVHEFQRNFGIPPRSNYPEHEAQLLEMVGIVQDKMKKCRNVREPNQLRKIDHVLIKHALRCTSSEWLPLSALIAGYASLQVIKFSGALGQPLHPQNQFLYFDFVDSTEQEGGYDSKGIPLKDSSMAAIFGVDQMKVFREATLLVVGMSCTNAEVLKNLSCIGFGSDSSVRVILDSYEKSHVDADDLYSRVIYSPTSTGKKTSKEIRNWFENLTMFEANDIQTSPWKVWTGCNLVVADSPSIKHLLKLDEWCRVVETPAIFMYEDRCGFRRMDSIIPHVTATLLERQLASEHKCKLDKFLFDNLSNTSLDKTLGNPVLSVNERLAKNSRDWFKVIFQTSTRSSKRYFQHSKVSPVVEDTTVPEEMMVWMSWTVVQRGLIEDYKDCLRVGWLMLELLPLWMQLEAKLGSEMQNVMTGSSGAQASFDIFAELDIEDSDNVQLLVATACIIGESVRVPVPPVETRRKLLSDVSVQRKKFSLHTNPRTWKSITESFSDCDRNQLLSAVNRVREISLDLGDTVRGHAHFLQSMTNLQISWRSRETVHHRVTTLPELRLLCRCERDFLPIVAILGAICTLKMTKLLLNRGSVQHSPHVQEYVATMTPTRSSALVSILEPPLPLIARSIPFEVTRGRPLRTVPEQLTRWSKIVVPTTEGIQTVNSIREYIERKFNVSVQSAFYRQRLVGVFGGSTATMHKESYSQSLFELCCSAELPRPPFILLDLVAVDLSGDVVLAPIKIMREDC